jgi:hypothetical protein
MPLSSLIDSFKNIVLLYISYHNIIYYVLIIKLLITGYLMSKHISYYIQSILSQPMYRIAGNNTGNNVDQMKV